MSEGQQTLLDAADLIEKKGWIQGANWRPGRGFCVFGAIDRVAKNDGPAFNDAVKRVYSLIEGHGIAKWNDEPGRTKEEVLAMLRRAAE